MGKEQIRPIAICVFRRDNRILVGEGYDPVKKERFYRPLGGRIEFGEQSQETIVREIREELGAEVTSLRYLGTVENIFTFNGEAGHEIVQVYDGTFLDESLYSRERLQGYEVDEAWQGAFTAVWKTLDDLREGDVPLYPDALLEMLVGERS